MHRQNSSSPNRLKIILVIVLSVVNLFVLAIAIKTVPQNLREMSSLKKEAAAISANMVTPAELLTEAPTYSETIKTDPAATELATTERPTVEDFSWVAEDDLPYGSVELSDFDSITGGWKGLIIYDPDEIYDEYAVELLNVNINGSPDKLDLTFKWYLIFWEYESESYDLTDMDDTTFTGRWSDGTVWATGPGNVAIEGFYGTGTAQYATGYMDTPDGIPAFFALVRP